MGGRTRSNSHGVYGDISQRRWKKCFSRGRRLPIVNEIFLSKIYRYHIVESPSELQQRRNRLLSYRSEWFCGNIGRARWHRKIFRHRSSSCYEIYGRTGFLRGSRNLRLSSTMQFSCEYLIIQEIYQFRSMLLKELWIFVGKATE